MSKKEYNLEEYEKYYKDATEFLRKAKSKVHDWHKIMPDESNYINMQTYCIIQSAITAAIAIILQESNDNVMNHSISTIILQEPDNTKGSRFTKWLKKKLFGPNQGEAMRIVFDNQWFADIHFTQTK